MPLAMSLAQCNAMASLVGDVRLILEIEAQEPHNFDVEVLI